MRYARNIQNNEIVSASRTLSRYLSLVCPVCGKRVYLRAGFEYAPHFAHYSGITSLECSLYNPNQGGKGYQSLANNINFDRKKTFQKGGECLELFICTNSKIGYQLSLRVPSAIRTQSWDGVIFIQSIIGERAFKRDKLSVPQLIPVSPSLSPYVVKHQGHVDKEYLSLLQSGLPGLDETGTWFDSSPIAGRRLNVDEAVFWGGAYQIVLKTKFRNQKLEPRHLTITEAQLDEEWLILEVNIPAEGLYFIKSEREEIETWCKRTIKSKLPKSFLIDPLPRGFNVEGSYIISPEVSKVLIEVSGEGELFIINDKGEELTYFKLEANIVSIENPEGSVRVFVGEVLTMKLVFEPFNIPSIPTVMVKHHENITPLFMLSTNPKFYKEIMEDSKNVSLVIPIESYEKIVTINGSPWSGNKDLQELLQKSNLVRIDAEGFGCCVFNGIMDITDHECPEHLMKSYQYLLALAYQFPKDPTNLIIYRRNPSPSWLIPLLRKWPASLIPQVTAFFRALSNEEAL